MLTKRIDDHVPKYKYSYYLVSILLILSDLLSITLSFSFAYFIRLSLVSFYGEITLSSVLPMLWFNAIFILVLFSFAGLYPGRGMTGVIELKKIFRIVGFSFSNMILMNYIMSPSINFSRFVLIFFGLFSTILISGFRIFLHNQGTLYSWWNQPVLIIGNKEEAEDVVFRLQRSRRMAYKPVICLITDQGHEPIMIRGIPSYPNTKLLQKEIRNLGISTVIFTGQLNNFGNYREDHVRNLRQLFPNMLYVLSKSPLSSLSMAPIDLEGRPTLQFRSNLLNPWSKHIKRFIDILICFFSLALSLPIILLISFIIKIDSPGPILFVQKRIGKNGKHFNLYKFRTMFIDSEIMLNTLLKNNKEIHEEFQIYRKIKKDPRITPFGRILRKTSLDELPQLWNVIKGEMNIVGPRAYLPIEKDIMGSSAELILQVSPGLTGWWQVMGRQNTTFQERLDLDKYYISNFSLWLDFYILIKTIWVVLAGKGT